MKSTFQIFTESEEKDRCITFVPSRVKGQTGVERVSVFPDRIEVDAAGQLMRYVFSEISRPQEARWRSTVKRILGLHAWPKIVADRDWFHEPKNRFFVFYTQPQITVFMPLDEVEDYAPSYFVRIQKVIRAGGYDTYDLG